MIEYLRKASLFSGLNKAQLQTLATICTRKAYRGNTVLFREKEPGATFYIVVTGSVKIYTSNHAGEEKILSVFHSGDSFGELSLIDGKPRSASAETLEDSILFSLHGQDFINALKNNFDISLAIMRELSNRLRDTNQHVHDLTFLDARTRVIKNLIQLANKGGQRMGTQIVIKTALNYDELARMAGVTKNILMQVLRDLQEKGMLTPGMNDFTIDLTKLR